MLTESVGRSRFVMFCGGATPTPSLAGFAPGPPDLWLRLVGVVRVVPGIAPWAATFTEFPWWSMSIGVPWMACADGPTLVDFCR